MKLIDFPEVNRTYAKDQPQYRPLPCHAFENDAQGRIVFCWKLRLWQRLRVLWTGEIWHHVLTFGAPLQPQLLGVEKPEMRHPVREAAANDAPMACDWPKARGFKGD